jgi:hypothetical protein
MIDWALDQFSEGAIWALVVLGVIVGHWRDCNCRWRD